MAVRVAMCLFAKGLSCVRSRADLAGALVQRSAEGVCDIWDLEAQQNREDPYLRTKTSQTGDARAAETATWKKMAQAHAIESDDTLLGSIGSVCRWMSGDFSSSITAWRSNTSTEELCYCRRPLFESRVVFSWDKCLEFALDIHPSIRFLESAHRCALPAACPIKHREDVL